MQTGGTENSWAPALAGPLGPFNNPCDGPQRALTHLPIQELWQPFTICHKIFISNLQLSHLSDDPLSILLRKWLDIRIWPYTFTFPIIFSSPQFMGIKSSVVQNKPLLLCSWCHSLPSLASSSIHRHLSIDDQFFSFLEILIFRWSLLIFRCWLQNQIWLCQPKKTWLNLFIKSALNVHILIVIYWSYGCFFTYCSCTGSSILMILTLTEERKTRISHPGLSCGILIHKSNICWTL